MVPSNRPHHRGIVPSTSVRLANKQARVGSPDAECQEEPKIVLVRDGDEVKSIEVVCTCGKRIWLNCTY